jgi:hypothetical protein
MSPLRCTAGLACLWLLLFALPAQAQEPPAASWTPEKFATLSEGFRQAQEPPTLYEGLPHQFVEHELFLRERNRKSVIESHGYLFYKRPLPLRAADAAAVREALLEASNYKPYSGPKSCGGFHPDYQLVWGKGRAAREAQICFGCREIKLFNNTQTLVADLPNTAFLHLRVLLDKYRAQRPPREPAAPRR